MTLEGKVAIVTGGNSGIGKAIALALARRKANIVIDYVAQEHATEELEHEIEALGDQATGVKADVSKVDDLQRLVDRAVKDFGRLDVMVNNAGIETRSSVLETTEQLRKHAALIMAQAVQNKAMPLGNQTNMTEEERAKLGAWLAAQR